MNLKQINLQKIPYINQSKARLLKEYFAVIPDYPLEADNPAVHLSASAVVFLNDQLFFVHHPHQHLWLLPAGHVERGETPNQTAQREFTEETGYLTHPYQHTLIDINVINIPENLHRQQLAHTHIDFRFLLKLTDDAPQEAELPTRLLSKAEALLEFKQYFAFNPRN